MLSWRKGILRRILLHSGFNKLALKVWFLRKYKLLGDLVFRFLTLLRLRLIELLKL